MKKTNLKKRLLKASLITGTILSVLGAGLSLWKMNQKEAPKQEKKVPKVRHFIDNPDVIVYSHAHKQKDQ